MCSETDQYESSHGDVDDEGDVYIVGCHHLCALINSRHFAINENPNRNRLVWHCWRLSSMPLRMVNQN